MKAAMTAVFAANQVNRKVSCPASKSDTTCSDPDPSSVAKGSSTEDESVIVKDSSIKRDIEQVTKYFFEKTFEGLLLQNGDSQLCK